MDSVDLFLLCIFPRKTRRSACEELPQHIDHPSASACSQSRDRPLWRKSSAMSIISIICASSMTRIRRSHDSWRVHKNNSHRIIRNPSEIARIEIAIPLPLPSQSLPSRRASANSRTTVIGRRSSCRSPIWISALYAIPIRFKYSLDCRYSQSQCPLVGIVD